MDAKEKNDLFFMCSVVEQIGRDMKLKRSEVVDKLGYNMLRRIFEYADVLHCEQLAKVAYGFSKICNMEPGDYDNVGLARYKVPSAFDIGKVYARLIEDVGESGDIVEDAVTVPDSWLVDLICNYNSDLYYQSRGYLAACYREGDIIWD